METPLCSICLESDDLLCNGCKAKIDDGELAEEAVTLSRMLYSLSETIPTLEDIEVRDVISLDEAVVILTAEGDGPKVVGRDGRIVKQIAEEFDRSIRIVEDTGDLHKVVDKLLAPAEYESINTVYKPDGEERKVVVDNKNEPRVPFTADEFEALVEQLVGESITLSFE